MYLSEQPQRQILVVDLENKDLQRVLRHEVFWHDFGISPAIRLQQGQHVQGQISLGRLSARLEQAKADGMICVGRVSCHGPAKSRVLARVQGIDHVIAMPDGQLNDPLTTLQSVLGVPDRTEVVKFCPSREAFDSKTLAAAFAACRPHQWIKN